MPQPIHYLFVAMVFGVIGYMGFVFLFTNILPMFMLFTREFKARPLTSQVRPRHYDYDEDN